ncbi:MAG TPA: FG-GAP-like repeat-containing protein [Kofleriaceae bacterium]|nr:FG-GAP-like repeat-containing protein [Kofleriaceae bacterium]
MMRGGLGSVLAWVCVAAGGCGGDDGAASIDATADGATIDGATVDGPGSDAAADASQAHEGMVLPVPDPGCATPPAVPTLLAPWSTSTVTSRTPTLRWRGTGGGGAHVEVCADRACTMIQQQLDTAGTTSSVTLTSPLAPGVHFWRVRAAGGATFSPVWELWSGVGSAATASASGSTLDVNGDGYADLVVGTDGSNGLYLYLGSRTGYPAAPITVPVPAGASRFGGAVASAGDVDGDGYGDLVVGASASGTAYVLLGGAGGLSAAPITLTGPVGSLFGNAVAGAGDLDGDGFADVAVGTVSGEGLYVYFGNPCGLGTTPIALPPPGGTPGSFGFGVAGALDVDGDGHGDLATTGPGHTVDLYFGGAGGLYEAPLVLPPPASSMTPQHLDYFGNVVARAGDVDGDGFDDLAVGAAGAGGTDTVYLFRGGAGGPATTPSATLTPPAGSASFGAALAGPGDVDGDGHADLAVGTSGSNTVYLFRGGAGGLSTTPVMPATSGAAGSSFGATLAAAGDVDDDGRADLGVGAPASSTVHVHAGAAAGLGAAFATLAAPAPARPFSFGYSLACVLARPADHDG